jgi:hypothetical protein
MHVLSPVTCKYSGFDTFVKIVTGNCQLRLVNISCLRQEKVIGITAADTLAFNGNPH